MFYDVAIICLILNDNRAKKKKKIISPYIFVNIADTSNLVCIHTICFTHNAQLC